MNTLACPSAMCCGCIFLSRKAGISIPCVPGPIWSTGSRGKIPGITPWNMMPVCPRAYLVHGLQGEDPRYYTVEYDASAMGYFLCSWDGEGNHTNYGPVEAGEDPELAMILKREKGRMEAGEK